jgi:hypothetical protein
MGELKGPILFTGSVGNIRAYYDKALKRYVLSNKGGANKDLIKTSPKLARQRENMNEFKGCSKWASQLKKSLEKVDHLFKGYYFSTIVAMAKLMQKQDDMGERGFRSIQSSKFPGMLPSLNFNYLHPFDQVFLHRYELQFSDDKTTVTLKLMDFKSFTRIYWPEKYESYRISLVIAQMPDFAWNSADKAYQPIIKRLVTASEATFTDWHPRSLQPVDIILSASFARPALQQPGTIVVVALGVEVSPYPLNASILNATGTGTMKIVECYV